MSGDPGSLGALIHTSTLKGPGEQAFPPRLFLSPAFQHMGGAVCKNTVSKTARHFYLIMTGLGRFGLCFEPWTHSTLKGPAPSFMEGRSSKVFQLNIDRGGSTFVPGSGQINSAGRGLAGASWVYCLLLF